MRLRQVLAVGAVALVQVRAPRRAGSRPCPGPARSAGPRASPPGRRGCRSSGRAGGRRSGASSRRCASSSQVQFDVSVSVKMIRASEYRVGSSDHTYQSRFGAALARLLEPGVIAGGVVHHQVGDHADAALVGGLDEAADVLDRAVVGLDREEVGDVVAAVAQRRLEERQQPDAVHAQPLQVVELLGQAAEVAGTVAVGVEEGACVDLVEDGRLEPQRLSFEPLSRVVPRALASTQSTFRTWNCLPTMCGLSST